MFGKITEIIDNYVYVENSTHELKNNILNIHVVFPEANHRVVGEVLSVNVDVIKIFLVGEIRNGIFFPGVMRKPSFQTIPRIIYKQELELLIGKQDSNDKSNIYLGKSVTYEQFDVKINLNDFFSNHFAIVGNSGSGKSCGVARILQNIFQDNKAGVPQNAHIVLFDVYGEYNDAFKNANNIPNLGYKSYDVDENYSSIKIPAYFLDIDDLNMSIKGIYGEWPSDEVFFTNVFDNLLNTDYNTPFMAFLTTVTTHQPYITKSEYGDLYKEEFMSKGYSAPVSRYFSKLKVLDNALGIMINSLKEKGILDDTVIVLTADHYPYGLKDSYLSEFINHDLEDYESERTPFVIYNPELESTEYTEYTSYINIIPTLANLMGIKYDPRLYMGTDILSETYNSRVVFADGSWKNEIAYYNASNSTIKYYTDEEYTVEEIQEINEKINMKLSLSTSAIKTNYFSYLENKINEYNNTELE